MRDCECSKSLSPSPPKYASHTPISPLPFTPHHPQPHARQYRRPVLVRLANSPSVTRGIAYSIASVFTPPAQRKKGYASLMMTLVHQKLNPTGSVPLPSSRSGGGGARGAQITSAGPADLKDGKYGRDAMLSFLYSDVGDFYEPYGWTTLSPVNVTWSPNPKTTASVAGAQDLALPTTIPIKESDLARLAGIDDALLEQELSQPPPSRAGLDEKARFAILTQQGAAWKWAITRSKFYADKFATSNVEPHAREQLDIWGASIPASDSGLDSKDEPRAFAIWSTDHRPFERTMYILRLRLSSGSSSSSEPNTFPDSKAKAVSELRALVRTAREAAHQQGLEKVVAWNVDPEVVRAAKAAEASEAGGAETEDWKIETRKDSLPGVAWYGERVRGLHFVANEKGLWC